MAVDLELDPRAVVVADEAVVAAVEAVGVDLEAVQEAGLHDAGAPLEVGQEVVDPVELLVVVEGADAGGHDAGQEEAAVAGGRVRRQVEAPQGDPSGRGVRARVPDLELGQEHPANLSGPAALHAAGVASASEQPATERQALTPEGPPGAERGQT